MVTRVQSVIKRRSDLLKNVSFTQAGLRIRAATVLRPSIINTPPAWQMGLAPLALSPALSGPLPETLPGSDAGRRKPHDGCQTRPGECPDLPVLLTRGWLLRRVEREKASLEELPLGGDGDRSARGHHKHRGEATSAEQEGGMAAFCTQGPGLHLTGLR